MNIIFQYIKSAFRDIFNNLINYTLSGNYRTKSNATLIIIGIISICFIISCDDSGNCNYLRNRTARITFATIKNSKTLIDTTVTMFHITALKDSNGLFEKQVYPKNEKITTAGLYLSMQSDTNIYFLKFDSTLVDTLLIFTSNELAVESDKCGFNFSFTIDSVMFTGNKIDSLLIMNKKVSSEIEENIKLVVKKNTN